MTVWPDGSKTRPDISSPYGYSAGYDGFHNGTDFINFNTNCAVDAGRVLHAGWTDIGDGGAGIEVRIQHDGYISRLLHNNSVKVSKGDWVSEGQSVGVQGTTAYGQFGRVGKHVHTEIWVGSTMSGRTDPVPFLQNRITSSAGGGGAVPITRKKNRMLYFNIPNPKPSGVYTRLYVLVTEDGRETTLTTGESSTLAQLKSQFGDPIVGDRALVDSMKNQLRNSGPSLGTVTVTPDKDLLAAVQALGPKIDALPAEIDRYADGKKQS